MTETSLHASGPTVAADFCDASWGLRVNSIKRVFDIVFAFTALVLSLPLLLAIALVIKLTSRGPVIHWSSRVGINNRLFPMPKFRSMRRDTPQIPTHLVSNPAVYLTRVGSFLRRTSLDELPQLFSILAGDLSFVGPRPALFNQEDLVSLRTERGIHMLVPGLTGWAQVNGRDELPIPLKVDLDLEYLQRRSFWFDLRIICRTIVKVMRSDGIQH